MMRKKSKSRKMKKMRSGGRVSTIMSPQKMSRSAMSGMGRR